MDMIIHAYELEPADADEAPPVSNAQPAQAEPAPDQAD